MNGTLRSVVIGFGVAVSLASVTACDDKPAAIPDVLAQDSTLKLQVMSARGDSSLTAADSLSADSVMGTPMQVAAAPATSAEPSAAVPSTRLTPAPRQENARSRAMTTPVIHRIIRRAAQRPARTSNLAVNRARASSVTSARRMPTSVPEITRARTGLISSGSTMSLVAGQQICSYASRVGDSFNNLVYQPVAGSNGVVIPRGALVVLRITSIGKGGSEIGVRAESVRIYGRTYPVTSDVTYAIRGANCIPERTRIESELTAPLTIVASSEKP
jgi:hypothetical protein